MKNHLLLILAVLVLVAAACSLPPALLPATPEATLATNQNGGVPDAVLKAQTALADDLGVDVNEVLISDYQPEQFTDSCLGVPQGENTCFSQNVSGWVITLKSSGKTYIYHSDQNGDTILPFLGVASPGPIALQSLQLLAGLMGYNPEAIQVLSETPTVFNDTCLGVLIPEVTCPVIPVHGEIVRLEADNLEFELRSQDDPIDPVISEIQGVSSTTAAITWSSTADSNDCSSLVVYVNNAVIHYDCSDTGGREPGITELTPQQQSQLIKWFVDIQSFDSTQAVANGISAHLYFVGIGKTPPSDAERQEIFQYAQNLLKNLFLATPTPTGG